MMAKRLSLLNQMEGVDLGQAMYVAILCFGDVLIQSWCVFSLMVLGLSQNHGDNAQYFMNPHLLKCVCVPYPTHQIIRQCKCRSLAYIDKSLV